MQFYTLLHNFMTRLGSKIKFQACFFSFLGMEFQQRHHQITNISTNQRNNPRNNKTITMRSEGIELDRNGFTNHTKATHVDLTI